MGVTRDKSKFSLVYIVTFSREGEKFTEFYILGPEGIARDFPKDVIIC